MKDTFLSRFTPSLMTPQALEAIFVQREALAQRVVELIRDSALTPSKHHTLLIGPRGIGKTHLISLAYHRVRAIEDLQDRLLIAWLREEEWGVASFLDLLLRVFRSLKSTSSSCSDDFSPSHFERIEALYNQPIEIAERAAASLLKEVVGHRTLLIVVENLEDLFNGLGEEGQQRLRSYLQENPFCTILATAQSLFNGVKLQTSPFYGFFRINHLEELNLEDATKLLTNIATFGNDSELVSFIASPTGRSRIRALQHLAGGNHRVHVIFSQFLTRESLDDLVDPFMQTLDDLTPYYQSRIAWLSPQQRKIVEFLCDRRGAVQVKEISQRCFITHQTTSSQLKLLREMGYVRSESVGRESHYELREPMMRLCVEVKRDRGEPIRLFVDFLRLWYSREELQQRLELLQPDAELEREYVLHALRTTEEETEDPRVAACLKDFNARFEAGDFAHSLEVAKELVTIRGHARDWFRQGYCLGELGRWDDAIKSFDKAIELDPNGPVGWSSRGWALLGFGRRTEALASYARAVDLDPNDALAWRGRGWAQMCFGRYEEALLDFDKATELNPHHVRGQFGRALASLALHRWAEGVTALDDALRHFPHADMSLVIQTGVILRDLFTRSTTAMWQARIATLIELYVKHQVLSTLGHGLVRSIEAFSTPMLSDGAARAWREVWQEVAGDRKEFDIPLRLLNAAVRYRETKDRRVLLELPVEERKVLESLLTEEGATE